MKKTVLVLVMGARNDLADKNIRKMNDTFVADALTDDTLEHEYIFAYYDGKWEYESVKLDNNMHMYHVRTIADDDIHNTYEKTMFAFEQCLDAFKFDVLVRINISAYLNIRLLDKYIDSIDGNCIYANKLLVVTSDPTKPNFLAPRGDFFMTGVDTIKGILEHEDIDRNRILDHVDDVLIGCAFASYVGNSSYVDRLKQIPYSYIPNVVKYDTPFDLTDQAIETDICYRLKTVPPTETVSGYSWEYNEYRECDAIKMERIHDILKHREYGGKRDINKIVLNDRDIPCIAVRYIQSSIGNIKNYIKAVGG